MSPVESKHSDQDAAALLERIQRLERELEGREGRDQELESFRQILECAPVAVYILSPEGILTYLNPAFEKLTGWSAAEWLNKPYYHLLYAEDIQRAQADAEEVLADRQAHYCTFRIRCRSGGYLLGDFLVRTLWLAGNPAGRYGIAMDVTRERETERRLHEKDDHYRYLFENAQIGIYRTTPDGRILIGNPALWKILGFQSEEELLSRNLEREGYHPETPRKNFKSLLDREGEIRGYEAKWITRDGGVIHIRENARAVRNPQGRVLYYEGTVEDITELREALEKTKALIEELQESSHAFPDQMFRFSAQGVLVQYRPGSDRKLPLLMASTPGRSLQEIFPMGVALLIEKLLNQAQDTGRLVTHIYDFPEPPPGVLEIRVLSLQNDQFFVWVRAFPDPDSAPAENGDSPYSLQ